MKTIKELFILSWYDDIKQYSQVMANITTQDDLKSAK